MGLLEILVIIITITLVTGIITKLIIDKKKGKTCCSDCSSCAECCNCKINNVKKIKGTSKE